MDNPYRQQLLAGIEQLSLSITDEGVDKLLGYHQLLVKWNKAYNLTAVRNPSEMIARHLLDSLSIASYLEGKRFIDVGAGAGLPGIVLAIVLADKTFDALDSNGKKTRFLFQVKTELGLENVKVHHSRVEDYQPEQLYDGILSRAFATLADMVTGSEQLLMPSGYFYAMKGVYPEEELKQLSRLPKNYTVSECHTLTVPGSEGERHLLLIGKA